jgi:hypothetical protein
MTSPALEWLYAAIGRPAMRTIPGYRGTVCVARCLGGMALSRLWLRSRPRTALPRQGASRTPRRLATQRSRDIAAATTERTVTDPTALDDELDCVRYEGYALEDGEHLDGVRGAAAPVVGPGGPVLAAISVVALKSHVLEREAAEVRAAARQASDTVAAAVERYALEPRIVYRLLASYGLRPVDAYL